MLARNSSLSLKLAAICVALVLTGCSGLQLKNMVPESANSVTTHHTQSIRIGSITGNREEFFGGPEMITAEEFKTVLTETFVRSKLFSSVEQSAADLELSAKFIAHGQVTSNGFNAEQAMVIEYTLANLRTGQELWKQSINSRHTATLSDALGGNARTRMAQEGCVRKNVEQLIEALNKLSIE